MLTPRDLPEPVCLTELTPPAGCSDCLHGKCYCPPEEAEDVIESRPTRARRRSRYPDLTATYYILSGSNAYFGGFYGDPMVRVGADC